MQPARRNVQLKCSSFKAAMNLIWINQFFFRIFLNLFIKFINEIVLTFRIDLAGAMFEMEIPHQ